MIRLRETTSALPSAAKPVPAMRLAVGAAGVAATVGIVVLCTRGVANPLLAIARFRLVVLATVVLVSGCAVMNPYVRHSRDVSEGNIAACAGFPAPHHALRYACGMAIRMEKARSEIVGTRSGLTATLFPIAGIVGYNSARGFNAPTNAALTAAGFAGYGATTTLAQPDRIRVYDRGLTSLYCGIGVYQHGLHTAAPESASRRTIRAEAVRVRQLLTEYRDKQNPSGPSLDKLNRVTSTVGGIESWLDATEPNRDVHTQLLAFVRNIVAKVNTQLTLTVPDNKQLSGDALSLFQTSATPGKPDAEGLRAATSDKAALASGRIDDPATALDLAVAGLIDMYERLASDTSPNTTQLNFNDCAFTDPVDVAFKGGVSQFMLGPGNMYSGATVDVARGTQFKTVVRGGVPPYTATVAKVSGPDSLDVDVTGTSGHSELVIVVPNITDTKSGTYRVVVSDASGQYAKWVEVQVPANQ